MNFFVNPDDLRGWVRAQPSSDEAQTKILSLLGNEREQDIAETCKAIFEKDDENASKVLFGVLAKHNFSQVKEAKNMNKEAQSATQSRQRNNWVRGKINKFNRVVDGFNEGTPWRIDRDKFYNFTHYYTDALSFDEDPSRIYSGEAIWRMYVMDKFTTEYQNKEGKWVGGYINDRFYVFPDAGTPANPDVPRDGGNQMGLPPGIKSRKPRPHQYSTERRLEEARGNKTDDLEAFASQTKTMVKISSKIDSSRENDKVYSIFKDSLDMREAGIEYETMIEAISDHYKTSITNVAEIDKAAQTLKTKHLGIAYDFQKEAQSKLSNGTYVVVNPIGIKTNNGIVLPKETELTSTGAPNMFTVVYHPSDEKIVNTVVNANVKQSDVAMGGGDQEVGLVGDESPKVQPELDSPEQFDINSVDNNVDEFDINDTGTSPEIMQ